MVALSAVGKRPRRAVGDRRPSRTGRFAAAIGSLAVRALPWHDQLSDFTDRAYHGRPLFWGGAMDFSESAKNRLLRGARSTSTETFEHTISPFWQNYCDARNPNDVTGWMSYLDLKFRLPELMLPRLDKMGMAFSVEGRVPFLDHRLVEFTMSLPAKWRAAKGSVGKPLFKSIATRRFDKSFVYQKKRGFQVPVKEWKSGAAGLKYTDALIAFSERTEIFEPREVTALLKRKGDRLYFSLLNFAMWYSIFIENVIEDHFDIENLLGLPE